jgi:hypothetical protein
MFFSLVFPLVPVFCHCRLDFGTGRISAHFVLNTLFRIAKGASLFNGDTIPKNELPPPLGRGGKRNDQIMAGL